MRYLTTGLVDTGASETLIPLELWDEIQPVFVAGETSDNLEVGNGASISVVYATIDMAIRLGHEVFRWHAKVGFTASRDEMVLGDAGFLRYFAVTCDRANKLMTIRRTGELPIPLMPQPTGPISRPFHEGRSIRPGPRPRPRRRR